MLKVGLVRLLAIVLFGFVVPFGAYRLSRRIGAPLTLLLGAALGLGYGALKADSPWNGDGLDANLFFMAASALVAAVYIGLAVWAAVAVARAGSKLGF